MQLPYSKFGLNHNLLYGVSSTTRCGVEVSARSLQSFDTENPTETSNAVLGYLYNATYEYSLIISNVPAIIYKRPSLPVSSSAIKVLKDRSNSPPPLPSAAGAHDVVPTGMTLAYIQYTLVHFEVLHTAVAVASIAAVVAPEPAAVARVGARTAEAKNEVG